MDRINFQEFNQDFMRYANMTNVETAIFAPIIYGCGDKYLDACVEFLKAGSETNLQYGMYSTDIIKQTMNASYIEALIILHNIETSPNEAPIIFNPNLIE